MQAIEYSVITSMGDVLSGVVSDEDGSNFIQAGQGDKISLHLDRSHIFTTLQEGDDLIIVLLDGRRITLDGYFTANAELYISADGELYQAGAADAGGEAVITDYTAVDVSQKWSPYDSLVFEDNVALLEPETALGPVFPLGALLGGGAGLGALTLNDGTDAPTIIRPSVDHPDAHTTLTTNTVDPAASVTGTGEPGSGVRVSLGDKLIETSVGSDGLWAVRFEDETFPSDGDLTSSVVVTAPGGTVYSLDGPDFLIDMTRPEVAVTEGSVTTGDIETAAEYGDGITIRGTGEIGATVTVEVLGETRSTTVQQDGTWAVTFANTQLPAGTYTEPMTVTATDINGNITVLNDMLQVDTEVLPFTHGSSTPNSILADGVVNAAEAVGGLVVTGTVEAGSSVTVQLATGTPVQAVVTGTTWSATIPAGSLPAGEYQDVALTVSATDGHGNTATQSSQIDFDTVLRYLSLSGSAAGDGVVNATDAADGFAISGTAEVGATVIVTLENGAERTVTAGADGKWSATFYRADLQTLSGTMTYSVAATDLAGNPGSLNEAGQRFTFDLTAPDAPIVTDKSDDGVTTRSLYTSHSEATHFVISTVAGDGTVTTVLDQDPISLGTEDFYDFGSAGRVPNGSYLVVTDHDSSGNTASTLLVVDGNSNVTFDLDRPGLDRFDFSSVTLEHTEATLTITEAQIVSLTGPANTLIISGDATDSVTAIGAQDTGADTLIGGQTHSIYAVGSSGALLLIDDQITNLTV